MQDMFPQILKKKKNLEFSQIWVRQVTQISSIGHCVRHFDYIILIFEFPTSVISVDRLTPDKRNIA